MTVVSYDPSWWLNNLFLGYFILVSSIAVIYDWVLTFGQEYELVWRQRFSLMSALYFGVRYIGILDSIVNILYLPSVAVTDAGCSAIYFLSSWTGVVANAMLSIIVITRLRAMYQQSRRIFIFLVLIFSVVQIACVAIAVIVTTHVTVEEFIFSGNHLCNCEGVDQVLISINWILCTIWEILALCLAIFIAAKHFHEQRRLAHPRESVIGDCFTVLMKSHIFYFASFVAVSFLFLGQLSPKYSLDPSEFWSYNGVLQVAQSVQMFVLGPRLILSIREYHANLVVNSDLDTAMTSIAFQERVCISTDRGV